MACLHSETKVMFELEIQDEKRREGKRSNTSFPCLESKNWREK